MRSASRKEQKDLVIKATLWPCNTWRRYEGKLEIRTDLDYKVEKYSRKGQLAFMTFFISDEATERLIQFFQSYKARYRQQRHSREHDTAGHSGQGTKEKVPVAPLLQ